MGKVINAIKKLYLSGYKRLFPMKYARHIGVNIAGDAEILGDIGWSTEPYLIHVGSKTRITNEVAFVTHDGAIVNVRRAGLSEKYKNVVKFGEIHVGDNCFIGTRSTILPDVTIGNNSIVGACSLVTKDIPPNEVWGGVPARKICTLEEYAEKLYAATPEYEPFTFKDMERATRIVKQIAIDSHNLKQQVRR